MLDLAAENKPIATNPNPTINTIKLGVKFPDLGVPEAVDGTDFFGATVGLALLTVGVGFWILKPEWRRELKQTPVYRQQRLPQTTALRFGAIPLASVHFKVIVCLPSSKLDVAGNDHLPLLSTSVSPVIGLADSILTSTDDPAGPEPKIQVYRYK